MLDHVTIRVSDYARSVAFYTTVLKELGYERLADFSGFSGYGPPEYKPVFWISQGEPTPSVHLCFQAKTCAAVDAFHRAALANGAKDNGPPGKRPHYHPDYYSAFAHDHDGYNIEAVCLSE